MSGLLCDDGSVKIFEESVEEAKATDASLTGLNDTTSDQALLENVGRGISDISAPWNDFHQLMAKGAPMSANELFDDMFGRTDDAATGVANLFDVSAPFGASVENASTLYDGGNVGHGSTLETPAPVLSLEGSSTTSPPQNVVSLQEPKRIDAEGAATTAKAKRKRYGSGESTRAGHATKRQRPSELDQVSDAIFDMVGTSSWSAVEDILRHLTSVISDFFHRNFSRAMVISNLPGHNAGRNPLDALELRGCLANFACHAGNVAKLWHLRRGASVCYIHLGECEASGTATIAKRTNDCVLSMFPHDYDSGIVGARLLSSGQDSFFQVSPTNNGQLRQETLRHLDQNGADLIICTIDLAAQWKPSALRSITNMIIELSKERRVPLFSMISTALPLRSESLQQIHGGGLQARFDEFCRAHT